MSMQGWAERVPDELFARRTLTLFGELDDATVTDVAARLWSLDALGDDPVTLVCSIRRSGVEEASTLLDVLDVVGVSVTIRCVGGLVGPAVSLLAAASRREAAASARFVLRDGEVSLAGTARQLELAVQRHHAQRAALLGRLADATGGRRSPGDLIADFERGVVLSACEALEYGLIDEITSARPRSDGGPPSFGFRPPAR